MRSPVPVTVTRSEPEPLTVPAMTFTPSAFGTGTDSPVIIDSFTSLLPLCTMPSAGTLAPVARARGRRHEVPRLRHPQSSRRRCVVPCWAATARARAGRRTPADRSHLDPVAEEHDGHQRGQLPPQRLAGITERHRKTEDERHRDRQQISVIIPGVDHAVLVVHP